MTVDARVTDTSDALAGVDMFAGLEPEARQRVAAAAVPRTYRKGQILFVEGDPGESLIILRRGAVAVFRTAPTGERAVLSVIRPPDVLGEVSLLDGSARSASAEAIEDSTALALSRAPSSSWSRQPAHARRRHAVAGQLIRRLTGKRRPCLPRPAGPGGQDPGTPRRRLVRADGTIELNQSQLAEMAGGSGGASTSHRILRHRGWLRTEGRRIVVTDLPALRRRAGGRPLNASPRFQHHDRRRVRGR
jgi:hypothetical protein